MKLVCWQKTISRLSVPKIRSKFVYTLHWIQYGLDITSHCGHSRRSCYFNSHHSSNLTAETRRCYRKSKAFLLLIVLCSTELTYAVIDIGFACGTLFEMIWSMVVECIVLESTLVAFFHTCIMAMIAIDRFLEIYLNIKYNIYWSVKKTKITLIVALAICFLSFIPLVVVALRDIDILVKLVAGYIFPALSLTFLIVVSLSYFYIIKQVLRHRKNTKRMQKQLQGNNKAFLNKQ